MEHDYVRLEGFNTLTARLLDVPVYRIRYRDIMATILDEAFTVEKLKPKVEQLHNLLRPSVATDPYIKTNLEIFDTEQMFIYQFIHDRNQYLREKLDSFL